MGNHGDFKSDQSDDGLLKQCDWSTSNYYVHECHMTSLLKEDPDVIEGDEEEVAMETTELTGEELLTRDYLATVSSLAHVLSPRTNGWALGTGLDR